MSCEMVHMPYAKSVASNEHSLIRSYAVLLRRAEDFNDLSTDSVAPALSAYHRKSDLWLYEDREAQDQSAQTQSDQHNTLSEGKYKRTM